MSLHYTTRETDPMEHALYDLGRQLHAAAAEGIRMKLASGEWQYVNGRYLAGGRTLAVAEPQPCPR